MVCGGCDESFFVGVSINVNGKVFLWIQKLPAIYMLPNFLSVGVSCYLMIAVCMKL